MFILNPYNGSPATRGLDHGLDADPNSYPESETAVAVVEEVMPREGIILDVPSGATLYTL